MPGDALNLDGYIRVSSVRGRSGESFISPDDQRDRIAAWAASRGVEIAEWHVDLDQSGGTLERPGLDKLMDRIRSGATGGVAVAYVDRLSRADVGDALRLVEEIHDLGGRFAALDLGIDPTTPFGEFGMTLMLALGRMQRRRIADGWAVAKERAVNRGVHGHASFGYRKSNGRGTPLEPDPDLAVIVRALFRRRVEGGSWAALARWMDTQAPPRKGGLWTPRAVETIVKNPVYKGEARYGQLVNASAHEPIVERELWDAAQEARGLRPARGEPWLLSGLVRCAGCRHRLVPATVGQVKHKVYRCKQRHNAGVCPSPAYIQRGLLEPYVERLFLERYRDVGLGAKIADAGLEAARGQLANAEAEVASYVANTSVRESLERLGGEHFQAGLDARVGRVVEAREAFDRLRRETMGLSLGPVLAVWGDLSVPERRRVLGEGVDAVFLRRMRVAGLSLDARVKVFWRGEAPHDLPGPGLRFELRGLEW